VHEPYDVHTGSVAPIDIHALLADQRDMLNGLRCLGAAVIKLAEDGTAQLDAALEQLRIELN
jgi:hypothetical protein